MLVVEGISTFNMSRQRRVTFRVDEEQLTAWAKKAVHEYGYKGKPAFVVRKLMEAWYAGEHPVPHETAPPPHLSSTASGESLIYAKRESDYSLTTTEEQAVAHLLQILRSRGHMAEAILGLLEAVATGIPKTNLAGPINDASDEGHINQEHIEQAENLTRAMGEVSADAIEIGLNESPTPATGTDLRKRKDRNIHGPAARGGNS